MVRHSFEVCPTGWQHGQPTHNLPFEPFIIDVPAPDHTPHSEARSARRAYFTVFSLLRDLEPEQWQMFDWLPHQERRSHERGMDGMPKNPVI